MATTVFYAWQSDRRKEVCRNLIKNAAERAIRKINADAEVQSAPPFDLDEATKGTTGHPHIASLIRRKIKSCGVFLADLTHVDEYETDDGKGRKKRAQNGNVLIELGMAIRAKGFGRLILVMNDAFGPPDDLPFDLKSHSYPITYTLGDASDPDAAKAARDRLANQIAAKLKPMLTDIASEAVRAANALPESVARTKVHVTLKVETQGHVRILYVDLLNDGIDLHDVSVRLIFRKAGHRDVTSNVVSPVGKVPDPLNYGRSWRFKYVNSSPHEDLDFFADPAAVALVVYSGVREVLRLPSSEWMDKLNAFARADLSLPPSPPLEPRRPVHYLDDDDDDAPAWRE